MKVLFITSTRIGDAVLATSVLNYIIKTYPRSSIFLASGIIRILKKSFL